MGRYISPEPVIIETDNAGLATSAKQLPDSHNVTVDNIATDDVIVVPATIGIDIFHYAVHAGLGFTMDVEADINGSEISIAFKTGSAAKYTHLMYKIDASAAANFNIYCGGNMSISGGTNVTPINRNQVPSVPASTMEGFATASWVVDNVTLNSTVTPGTAKVLRHSHIGQGRKIGGGGDAAWEFMLPAATICALVLNDDAAGANQAEILFSWFEVPPV